MNDYSITDNHNDETMTTVDTPLKTNHAHNGVEMTDMNSDKRKEMQENDTLLKVRMNVGHYNVRQIIMYVAPV